MKALFKKLKTDYDRYAKERRELIKASSDILTLSKRAIFSLHRDDKKEARGALVKAEATIQSLQPLFKKIPDLEQEGSFRAALEEYIEAQYFSDFLEGKEWKEIEGVLFDADLYIGALSDVTGELVRKATLFATEKKDKEVRRLAQGVRDVVGEFLLFDLTGYLRTKFDQAKNNLRRAEEILYDISLRRNV